MEIPSPNFMLERHGITTVPESRVFSHYGPFVLTRIYDVPICFPDFLDIIQALAIQRRNQIAPVINIYVRSFLLFPAFLGTLSRQYLSRRTTPADTEKYEKLSTIAHRYIYTYYRHRLGITYLYTKRRSPPDIRYTSLAIFSRKSQLRNVRYT